MTKVERQKVEKLQFDMVLKSMMYLVEKRSEFSMKTYENFETSTYTYDLQEFGRLIASAQRSPEGFFHTSYEA